MAHKFTVLVKGETNSLYDLVSQHFSSLGYRIVSGDRPNALSFTRGSWLGMTFASGKRSLAVSLIPKGEDVVISCTFEMPGFWLFSGDKAKLQLEVEGLRSLVR